MLDQKYLRENIDKIAEQLSVKQYIFDVKKYTDLEQQRKVLQVQTQSLQNERNDRSKEIGIAKSKGEDIQPYIGHMNRLIEELDEKKHVLAQIQKELNDFLLSIPNLPHESVPRGTSEKDNVEIRRWSEPKKFTFDIKSHEQIAEQLGLMDFETAAKITGSRYVILKGVLAKLHRALIQFMMDVHCNEHGYQEIYVPYIVNESSMYGTGQLPKFSQEQFKIEGEGNFYLIPTAEVPVINTLRDSIITAAELPLRYVCHTPCFRSEAGSYGKDIRGMIRQHQFEKVELVWFVKAEDSYEALAKLTHHAEVILQKLQLPYRIVELCGADLGFSAAKTYDIEVWLPSQHSYREISSCSNCEDFQSRRMNARWRDPQTNKPKPLHTLNGSGLAIGRTLVAIIENYQDEHGRIHIPEVLQPYMNHLKVI